jgi:hypothetical protein
MFTAISSLFFQSIEQIALTEGLDLVRDLDGHFEIAGGTEEDQREAREWASRFLRRSDSSGSIR